MNYSGPDLVIAGQGIAGTVLALAAIQRGFRVLVVDPGEPNTCSRVAAGLINPLSGPRLALGIDEERLWFTARDFYRHWESVLGASFFEERPIFRLFTSAEQADRWKERTKDPRYAPWHAPLPENWDISRYSAPWGGFLTRRCGRIDTVRLLDAARSWLRARGSLTSGHASLRDASATVAWCTGYQSRIQGLFQSIPIRPARGTILTVQAPDLTETGIVHGGKWIVPIGGDRYRVGSTYEWEPQDSAPSPQSRKELTTFLNHFLRLPWEIVAETAAIRPMANRGHPFLARHPNQPNHLLFNGLGSRGALLAPWHAQRLLDLFEHGTPLDPQVDAARWLAP